MKQSEKPLWRVSMLQNLNLYDVRDWLWEIGENGDAYGYEGGDEGYYQEYKELFDELSDGAGFLLEALDGRNDVGEHWDDMTVAVLGNTTKVLGYDSVEQDYFGMLDHAEEWAVYEAEKRLGRMTKQDMLKCFAKVMTVLSGFFDLKAAHDCLTSIVTELDERGALLERKNQEINRLYHDLTGGNEANFDALVQTVPQRMWVE